MNEKKNDYKRSIGVVSRELEIEQHTIRFWEKEFPQLKATIGKGGRRYYYNKDVENLKKIKYLLHSAGFSVKGLKKILLNNKNFLKEGLESIKNMDKIIDNNSSNNDDNNNINQEKLTENINKLITVKNELQEVLEEMDKCFDNI